MAMTKKAKIKFYQDKRGKWRWRIRAVNGEIIGASTQGFSARKKAVVNLNLIRTVLWL